MIENSIKGGFWKRVFRNGYDFKNNFKVFHHTKDHFISATKLRGTWSKKNAKASRVKLNKYIQEIQNERTEDC